MIGLVEIAISNFDFYVVFWPYSLILASDSSRHDYDVLDVPHSDNFGGAENRCGPGDLREWQLYERTRFSIS